MCVPPGPCQRLHLRCHHLHQHGVTALWLSASHPRSGGGVDGVRTPWRVDNGSEKGLQICFSQKHRALAASSAPLVPPQPGLAAARAGSPIPDQILKFQGCARELQVTWEQSGPSRWLVPGGFSPTEGPWHRASPPPRVQAGADSVPKLWFLFHGNSSASAIQACLGIFFPKSLLF